MTRRTQCCRHEPTFTAITRVQITSGTPIESTTCNSHPRFVGPLWSDNRKCSRWAALGADGSLKHHRHNATLSVALVRSQHRPSWLVSSAQTDANAVQNSIASRVAKLALPIWASSPSALLCRSYL